MNINHVFGFLYINIRSPAKLLLVEKLRQDRDTWRAGQMQDAWTGTFNLDYG